MSARRGRSLSTLVEAPPLGARRGNPQAELLAGRATRRRAEAIDAQRQQRYKQRAGARHQLRCSLGYFQGLGAVTALRPARIGALRFSESQD